MNSRKEGEAPMKENIARESRLRQEAERFVMNCGLLLTLTMINGDTK